MSGRSTRSSGGGSARTSDVVDLTDSNFVQLVLQSEDSWLVEFFAPWCGHCQVKHMIQLALYLSWKVQTSFEGFSICVKILPKFPSGLEYGLLLLSKLLPCSGEL